jgi:hypothetical protein
LVSLIAVIVVLAVSLAGTILSYSAQISSYNAEISDLSNPYTGYPTADPHGYVIAPLSGPFDDWPMIGGASHVLYDLYFATPDQARNVYVNGSASQCKAYTESNNVVHCTSPAFFEIYIVNNPLRLDCSFNSSGLGATVYDSGNITGYTNYNVPVPPGANCFFMISAQSTPILAGQQNATVLYTWPENTCPPANSPTLDTFYITCIK